MESVTRWCFHSLCFRAWLGWSCLMPPLFHTQPRVKKEQSIFQVSRFLCGSCQTAVTAHKKRGSQFPRVNLQEYLLLYHTSGEGVGRQTEAGGERKIGRWIYSQAFSLSTGTKTRKQTRLVVLTANNTMYLLAHALC